MPAKSKSATARVEKKSKSLAPAPSSDLAAASSAAAGGAASSVVSSSLDARLQPIHTYHHNGRAFHHNRFIRACYIEMAIEWPWKYRGEPALSGPAKDVCPPLPWREFVVMPEKQSIAVYSCLNACTCVAGMSARPLKAVKRESKSDASPLAMRMPSSSPGGGAYKSGGGATPKSEGGAALLTNRIVVMDNGANTCKVGFATTNPIVTAAAASSSSAAASVAGGVALSSVKLIPNCATKPKRERRLFVGDQIDEIIDFTALNYRRPFERGYVVNWELQTMIWDRAFGSKNLNVDTRECSLLVTEPPFNLSTIRSKMDELVFEKYGFLTYCRMQAAGLAARGVQLERAAASSAAASAASSATATAAAAATPSPASLPCAVIVDSGYSFTHVTPLFDYQPINYATKRIDVGGKLLTNLLKEMISYRKFNLMDETHLMNNIKERLCYVSLNYMTDLELTKSYESSVNTIKREYVFPNGTTRFVGYVKGEDKPSSAVFRPKTGGGGGLYSKPKTAASAAADDEEVADEDQILVMNNERISVPEVLFHPSDIGMKQAGVAEAIVQSISCCPLALQPLMYSNVVLVGGNTCMPNYAKRVATELRSLAPAEFPVNVYASTAPMTAAWSGGSNWAATDPDAVLKHSVTRADYNELGAELCSRLFY